MSLRVFHLLFIVLSALLAVFFAAWAVAQYRMDAGLGYAAAGVIALAAGAALVVYASAFLRKTRSL
jgi:hypothetical protein